MTDTLKCIVCQFIGHFPVHHLLVPSSIPHTVGRERVKKEADHSRFGGDRFNKQGSFPHGTCLWQPQLCRSPHLPASTLKVCARGPRRVQSRVSSRWSQRHLTLSRPCLRAASSRGKASRMHIPRTREGLKSCGLAGSSRGSASRAVTSPTPFLNVD